MALLQTVGVNRMDGGSSYIDEDVVCSLSIAQVCG